MLADKPQNECLLMCFSVVLCLCTVAIDILWSVLCYLKVYAIPYLKLVHIHYSHHITVLYPCYRLSTGTLFSMASYAFILSLKLRV